MLTGDVFTAHEACKCDCSRNDPGSLIGLGMESGYLAGSGGRSRVPVSASLARQSGLLDRVDVSGLWDQSGERHF